MKALVIILAIVGVLFLLFLVQPLSRKSFVSNLLKQLIYLVPGYFA